MFIVYPEGYCPQIAVGPPPKDLPFLKWSENDTKKHQEMEKKAVLMYTPITGRWYMKVKEKN